MACPGDGDVRALGVVAEVTHSVHGEALRGAGGAHVVAGYALPTVRAAEVHEVIGLPVAIGVGGQMCGVRGKVGKKDGRRGGVGVPRPRVHDDGAFVFLGGDGAPLPRGSFIEDHLWMFSW